MKEPSLSGQRILVVEDEPLIALDVEQICLEFGAASVQIVRSACKLSGVDMGEFDVAILDRSLGTESSHEFAQRLYSAGVPFVFTSGLADDPERAEFPKTPLVPKPFATAQLIAALEQALSMRASATC